MQKILVIWGLNINFLFKFQMVHSHFQHQLKFVSTIVQRCVWMIWILVTKPKYVMCQKAENDRTVMLFGQIIQVMWQCWWRGAGLIPLRAMIFPRVLVQNSWRAIITAAVKVIFATPSSPLQLVMAAENQILHQVSSLYHLIIIIFT